MLAESNSSMRTWWIDESTLLAASNPSDHDLSALRAKGFGVAVSLLDANHQPPKYDARSAADSGWMLYMIPVDRTATPTLVQACEFVALMGAVRNVTKSL